MLITDLIIFQKLEMCIENFQNEIIYLNWFSWLSVQFLMIQKNISNRNLIISGNIQFNIINIFYCNWVLFFMFLQLY